jgi:Zn-dependent peptidase ImmA (M78 family)
MHEISHLLIGHKPSRFDITEDNLLLLRYCDGDQEEEANWLAGSLLLPREALLHIRRKKLSDAEATKLYHTSKQMRVSSLRSG